MERKLFKVMLPAQILSSLAMAICIQIDSIMIGRYLGSDAMAAYGLVNPVLLITTAIAGLFSTGIVIVCSQLAGKNDKEGIKKNFSSALVLALILAVIGFVVLFAFNQPIAAFLGAKQHPLIGYVRDYLFGYAIGLPCYFFLQALLPYLHVIGKRMLVSASIIVMIILDVIFDVIAAVTGMGMFGMAIATSASEIGAFLLVAFYFLFGQKRYRFTAKLVSLRENVLIIKTGAPLAINQICFTLLVYFVNQNLLLYGGNDAVAAYSVVCSVSTFCFTVSNGIGGVTQILSGIFFGERDHKGMNRTVSIGLCYALVMNAILVILVMIFARQLAVLFLKDATSVVELGTTALRFYIVAIIPIGISSVFKSLYQSTERTHLAEAITAIQNFFAPMAAMYLLTKILGLTGIWLAFVVGELLAVLFTCIVVWVRNRSLALKVDNFLMLPDGFGAPIENVLDLTIRGMNEISPSSVAATGFCVDKGQSERLSNYIGLCIEEMAFETVEKGFKKKRDTIWVRLVWLQEEGWSIRISDNCSPLDPIKYAELRDASDPLSKIGIKIVLALAKDAQYINVLGFNNLTLKLSEGDA